jgi:hypothetical protein
MTKERTSLFTTGFIGVFFIVANTYFISVRYVPGIAIASFMISYVWTINVRKVAIGTRADRVIYALGATCGSITGYFISQLIA